MKSGLLGLLIVLQCASFFETLAQPVYVQYPRNTSFSSQNTFSYNFSGSALFSASSPLKTSFVQACKEIDWTTWSSIGGKSASGSINNHGTAVTVSMTSGFDFESAAQLWRPEEFRRFKGNMPASAVPRTSWSKEPGGKITICFSQAVKEPVLLLASLGSYKERIQTTISFSEPYTMVFNDGGMIVNSTSSITGREGYAIIKFPGDIKCITITSSTYENFTDLTWGIPVCPEGLKPQPKAPEPPIAKPAPIAKVEPPIPPAKKIESPPAPKPVPATESVTQPAKLAEKVPEPVPVPKPVVAAPQPAPAIAKAEPPMPPAKKIELPPVPKPAAEPVTQPATLAAKVPEPLPVSKPVVAAPKPAPAIAQAEKHLPKEEAIVPPKPIPILLKEEPVVQPAKVATKIPEPATAPRLIPTATSNAAIPVPLNRPQIDSPAVKAELLTPKAEPVLASLPKAVQKAEVPAPVNTPKAVATPPNPAPTKPTGLASKPQTRPAAQPLSSTSPQSRPGQAENRLTIAVSDYDGVDRDSISLKFNNKPLGPASIQLQLSSRNGSSDSTFGLDLQPGNNSLEIYALSEGLKPFTTVCLQIRYPGKVKNLYFTLKAKESTVIQL